MYNSFRSAGLLLTHGKPVAWCGCESKEQLVSHATAIPSRTYPLLIPGHSVTSFDDVVPYCDCRITTRILRKSPKFATQQGKCLDTAQAFVAFSAAPLSASSLVLSKIADCLQLIKPATSGQSAIQLLAAALIKTCKGLGLCKLGC